MQSRKKVGIIGSGPVGQTLVSAFSFLGYETRIGSRSPEKLKELVAKSKGRISAGNFEQVAAYGDILVLATHGDSTENAIDLAGVKNFAQKMVIDATNPLDFSQGMPPGIDSRYSERSLGEQVQDKLQDARVVKCFNTAPNTLMFRPKFDGMEMLICGNDPGAKKEATKILKEFGWAGSIDIGGIENAKWLEAMVPLWVRAASVSNQWVSTFKFVK